MGRWPWSRALDSWRGFCPCCKRPLDLRLSEPWGASPPRPEAVGNFAFVINLWGASPAYVLGALVLGYSIKRTGSRHARVCLHTADVPEPYLRLLSRIWDCRQVEHVEVAPGLSVEDQCERFEKVFTKLRGMNLTEFEKILVMDIDLLVRANIDELFELAPPAAMKRGMNDSQYPTKHGDPIDARCFFLGKDSSKWSWGVGTGINAGTMLWQPDRRVLREMLEELWEPNHPEHMRGNGPEQDYLSRFWADAPWSHIGVEYNFQLHQMFFAIHPDRVQRTERAALLQTPEKIKIVHYSGVPEAKPWHRILDPKWADFWPDRSKDAEYAALYAEEFQGYWLWVKRDRDSLESATRNTKNWDVKGMFIGSDGLIYREPWDDGEGPSDGEPELLQVPEAATRGAVGFLETVLKEWFDTLQELEQELGLDLRKEMFAAADAVAESSSPQGQAWSGSTGGTGGEDPAQPRRPADTRGARAAVTERPGSLKFSWDRPFGGWWVERKEEAMVKVSVLCGTVSGKSFVTFIEDGEEVFDEQDPELAGVFVKVAGPYSVRRFAVPVGAGAGDALQEALDPIHFWVKGVPEGTTVLLAILCVSPDATPRILEALAPLGVPQRPPPRDARALAAVGRNLGRDPDAISREEEARGGAWHTQGNGYKGRYQSTSDFWFATHASTDIAYTAMPWPIE